MQSKGSNQLEHLPSLVRIFAVRLVGDNGPKFLPADSKSDQTELMHRLILVLLKHSDIVGFLMSRL